ncbi:hypothetical protein BJ875DRAFT_512636 [Amylocarpus encephaloides]|uniref:Uncharacterized protein n=1 Tax=Amylocarpus encephaloides TaxID=45428 RepID=A0A9P7YHG6_9HELO|nr:hypothetical protein BJ875DRAFT_512636 [Amylocarpus encephaloides]
MTPEGLVIASFPTIMGDSRSPLSRNSPIVTREPPIEHFAAKISVVPSKSCSPPPHVVTFEFVSNHDPSAKLAYHNMIPNNSEIFQIIKNGTLWEFEQALENRTASLTDRDEEGRSLLNYAVSSKNANICKFLLSKGADADAIEMSFDGDIMHIHLQTFGDEDLPIESHEVPECCKIFLKSGADFSATINDPDLNQASISAIVGILLWGRLASIRYVLDNNWPLIDPSTTYQNTACCDTELSLLVLLASSAGYDDVLGIGTPHGSPCITEKAIILIQRKFDISCRNCDGGTLLYTILKCSRLREKTDLLSALLVGGDNDAYEQSGSTPKKLLMLFIATGVDVYATDDSGRTAAMAARRYNRLQEWNEALEYCGFDIEEVYAASRDGARQGTQISKIYFEDYCRIRPHDPQESRVVEVDDTEDMIESESESQREIEEVYQNRYDNGGREYLHKGENRDKGLPESNDDGKIYSPLDVGRGSTFLGGTTNDLNSPDYLDGFGHEDANAVAELDAHGASGDLMAPSERQVNRLEADDYERLSLDFLNPNAGNMDGNFDFLDLNAGNMDGDFDFFNPNTGNTDGNFDSNAGNMNGDFDFFNTNTGNTIGNFGFLDSNAGNMDGNFNFLDPNEGNLDSMDWFPE